MYASLISFIPCLHILACCKLHWQLPMHIGFHIDTLVQVHRQLIASRFRLHRIYQNPVSTPFRVLAKINDNAYKIELPKDFGVSTTFNVADLTPYFGPEESESRTTPFQQGEDDEAISTNHAPYHVNQAHDVEDVTQAREQVNIGPITRSQAKKLQQ